MFTGSKLTIFNTNLTLQFFVKIICFKKTCLKIGNINNNNNFFLKGVSCDLKRKFLKKQFFIFIFLGLKKKIKYTYNGIYISFNLNFGLNCFWNKKKIIVEPKTLLCPIFYTNLSLRFLFNKNNFFF